MISKFMVGCTLSFIVTVSAIFIAMIAAMNKAYLWRIHHVENISKNLRSTIVAGNASRYF